MIVSYGFERFEWIEENVTSLPLRHELQGRWNTSAMPGTSNPQETGQESNWGGEAAISRAALESAEEADNFAEQSGREERERARKHEAFVANLFRFSKYRLMLLGHKLGLDHPGWVAWARESDVAQWTQETSLMRPDASMRGFF